MDHEKNIEIPFGAHDSELKGWEYTIPEGFTAEIKDRKVIVREKTGEDEKIRRQLINVCNDWLNGDYSAKPCLNDIKWLKNLLENQKEQKPVEWSEKDETCFGYALWCVTKTRYFVAKDACDLDVCQRAERWLESLHERFYLQPKQEWSEEDITNGWTGVNLERYLSCLQRLGTGNPQQPETINSKWFKEHCRPEPREEIYQSAKHDLAIRFMNYLDENRPEGKMGLSNGECEDIDKAFKENDWAKIMRYVEKYRPSWKPSDEQMQCLLAVITNQYNAGAESCHLTLGSLYNDLKKLK